MKIFEEKYSGEEICDVGRDVCEAFDADFNPIVAKIPSDEYGFDEGTFRITIEWSSTEYFPDDDTVTIPKNKEQAEMMIRVASFYLDSLKRDKTK